MIAASILSLFTSGANSVQPNEPQQVPVPATLALSDLWQECPKCHGTGEPEPPKPVKSEGLLDPNHFLGQVAATSSCRACEGRRGKPTPAGEAVLAFLEKVNAKPYRNSLTGQYLRGA